VKETACRPVSPGLGNVKNNDPSLIEPIQRWCRLAQAGTKRGGDSQSFVTGADITSPQKGRPLPCAVGFSRISRASLTTLANFYRSAETMGRVGAP
jgi:hypothetical protein